MSNKPKLLIVEDDPGLQKQLKWGFDDYKIIIASDRQEALTALRKHQPKVITLDLGLPPDPANASEGLASLKEILQLSPSAKVIVVTGNDDRKHAVEAIAMGAYDFYQKPIDLDILNLIVKRAHHLVQLEHENQLLTEHNKEPLQGIIATSVLMQDLCRLIEKVAPTNATTLLLGESGTGKEVLAKAMHKLSERSKSPFIAVNCAAIPENLLESELFGHEKGAFTGAIKQTKGKIEYAHEGTLLLDEIGDLPFPLQAKLLRFLQERTIERIGGRKEIEVDVRIICATHQDLNKLIEEGRFRSDLYYRISEITLDIPPLRERKGDALAIAINLIKKFNTAHNKQITGLTQDAIQAIESYDWPGNIRQLENVIKKAVILSDQSKIDQQSLDITPKNHSESIPLNLKEVRKVAETNAINRALQYSSYNISETAKLLGITRPTLYNLFNKYGIRIE